MNDRKSSGREKTSEPITTPGSIDEQSPQPTKLGGVGGLLKEAGRSVARAAPLLGQRLPPPRSAAAFLSRRRLPGDRGDGETRCQVPPGR